MHTSIVLVALLSPQAAPKVANLAAPPWQESYRAAREAGRSQRKPLAVILGSGSGGWEKLTTEGKLSPTAVQLLNTHYVCLYVDRDTAAGASLARSFDSPSGTGLVLSSRSGDEQAFSYQGTMTTGELESTLQQHSNATVVQRTETLPRARTSSYYSPDPAIQSVITSGYAGTAGSAVPTYPTQAFQAVPRAYAPPMTYAPPMSYGGFSGGFSRGFSGGSRGGC